MKLRREESKSLGVDGGKDRGARQVRNGVWLGMYYAQSLNRGHVGG